MTAPRELHIDFETRSVVDLRKAGAYRYANDPSTELLCACWQVHAENGVTKGTWRRGDPVPPVIRIAVMESWPIYAHNAAFEIAIWNHVATPKLDWPEPDPLHFRCTAAMAAAMALPRDLERAAWAMALPVEKDKKGQLLMRSMSKPYGFTEPEYDEYGEVIEGSGKPLYHEDEERMGRLVAYCERDVEVECELARRLYPLSDAEQRVWQLDRAINTRGIAIDLDAVEAASGTVEAELKRLDAELQQVTRGAVRTVSQVKALTEWFQAQGVDLEALDKHTVADALKTVPPGPTRRALEIRQEAAKSSTSKLNAFKVRAERIGDSIRIRENFMYHGAGTGRWAAKGVQTQNMPRPSRKMPPGTVDHVIENLHDAEYLRFLFDSPMNAVADILRGLLIAKPGHRLIAADFANIEGRVLAWLAGEEWKLEAFRAFDAGTGPDIYKLNAAGIYGIPHDQVDSFQRLIGKVSELALGFGGGIGAFQSMAGVYGVKVPDEQADGIKVAWRDKHPATVQLWRDLEHAAMAAVRNRSCAYTAGHPARPCIYKASGGLLWCKLPSGRVLAYPQPKIEPVEVPWGGTKDAVTYMGITPLTNKWERQKTYGGFFAENVTQAVARDLLAEAMLRLEAAGYPIVQHAHDEAVAEVPNGRGSLAEFERIMCTAGPWADRLPVVAEGWEGHRYRK